MIFRDGDVENLSTAIIATHRDRDCLLKMTSLGAKLVRTEHNPESFLVSLAYLAKLRATSVGQS